MTEIKRAYSKAHPGKYALVLDFETTGSSFGGDSSVDYQAISFGAVITDTETWEPVATLYREMHFDDTKYKWTDGAEKIHGLSRAHLAEHGVPREEALADLLELIIEYIGSQGKILLVGHNVEFDRSFLHQLANDFDVPLVLHHVMIDTSGMGFVMIGKYKSNDVFDFFCGERAATHNALDDALMCLTVVRSLKQLVQAALES